MKLFEILKKIFINPLGIDVVKYPNRDLRRRKNLLGYFKINKVLDVGANAGQYAQEIKSLGYKGEIISFEPISETYKKLKIKANRDIKWSTYNFALGNKNQEVSINISKNSYSSSIMNIKQNHIESAPESKYISKETISVKKLDSIYNTLTTNTDIVFLKIDVQGFEKNVLDGAADSLSKIKGIQLEMALTELYEGETLFEKMVIFLNEKGFRLYSLENGFYNPLTGQLLQVDGIFFKN